MIAAVTLRSVLAAVCGVAVSFGGGYLLSQRDAQTHAAVGSPNVVTEVRSALLARYVRPLAPSMLTGSTVGAVLGHLRDPYTVYLTPSQYEAVRAAVASEEIGVGLRVAPGPAVLRVLGAAYGSPAARHGVRRGDAILAIDGVSTNRLSFDAALARLRGVSGTRMVLRIQHSGGRDPVDVKMVRVRLAPDQVTARDIGKGADRVRVIRIGTFAHGVTKRVHALLQGRTPVIIDLRGDPGGLLAEAAHTADLFLSQGPIVSWRGAHVAPHEIDAHRGHEARMRVVVLVDRQTASAAEILTAALQDDRRATVVGTRTFGKASVQAIEPLPTGGALKLTIATYRTPLGHDLHGHGVIPDVAGGAHPLRRALAIARQ
jgi:carboxyl-terminal processing protease